MNLSAKSVVNAIYSCIPSLKATRWPAFGPRLAHVVALTSE
jgi:hypothetical protein